MLKEVFVEFHSPRLSNGTFLVVSSHMTWMTRPDLPSAPLGLILEGAVGLCGCSTAVVVCCLTDRHCVRKRFIDSTTASP